jgi:hypothetical protein
MVVSIVDRLAVQRAKVAWSSSAQSGTAKRPRVPSSWANAYHNGCVTRQMSKEELRKRIERDPQLKKDFDFLIAKTGLTPEQLLVVSAWIAT